MMATDSLELKIDIPEELAHLIPGFLDRRDAEVGELKKMIAEKDFDGMKMLGHKLKGQGGGYGLFVLTEIGAELEKAAKDSSLREVETVAKKYEMTLQQIRNRLNL